VAVTWEILHRWAPSLPVKLLSEGDINHMSNALTLHSALHKVFRQFQVCFVATDVPNTYQVRTWGNAKALTNNCETVEFINHDTEKYYPLPDPRLLVVHAALANVFHMSGVGEVIDAVFRYMETTRTMASDGSTDVFSLLAAGFT